MSTPHIGTPNFLARFAGPALPAVIGHRGAAARAPENTLAGLRRAKALGCAWVEFDARLSADGVPVLCHDPRLDRTTTGTGYISAQALSIIRACDAGVRFAPEFAGERVPTLEEALLLCAGLDLGANIELKADQGRHYAVAAAVAATLTRLQGRLGPVLVSSFQPACLHDAHRHAPCVPRGILFRIVPRNWSEIAARFDCSVIGADHRRLRPRRVGQIRAAGYLLAAYTVNDPARARLLFDWGVTSVFSDVPDIIHVNAVHRPARPTMSRPTGAPPHGPALARQGAIR